MRLTRRPRKTSYGRRAPSLSLCLSSPSDIDCEDDYTYIKGNSITRTNDPRQREARKNALKILSTLLPTAIDRSLLPQRFFGYYRIRKFVREKAAEIILVESDLIVILTFLCFRLVIIKCTIFPRNFSTNSLKTHSQFVSRFILIFHVQQFAFCHSKIA